MAYSFSSVRLSVCHVQWVCSACFTICCCRAEANQPYNSNKEGILILILNSESNISWNRRFAWGYGKIARLPYMLEKGIHNDNTPGSSGCTVPPQILWQVAPASTTCSEIRCHLLPSCLLPGYCSSVQEEGDDKPSAPLPAQIKYFGILLRKWKARRLWVPFSLPSTRERIKKLNIFPQTSPCVQGFALVIARYKGILQISRVS